MSKDNKEFTKALDNFRREVRADFRTLKDSVKFCSDTCDGVNSIAAEVKALRKEIQSLTESNQHLQEENQQLSTRIEELEQYQRSNNLELRGLPLEGEPYQIVTKICDMLGEPIAVTDIDICHRVATAKSSEKNIIVRFVNRSKRNAVMAKSKKKRLSTSGLDLPGPDSPVFINDHLTRLNKQLLGAAIARKRVVKWRFVWTSGGKIFARKAEDAVAVRIASMQDLEKMSQ